VGFLVVDTVGFLVVASKESSLTLSEMTARLTRKVEEDCFTQYLSNDLTKVALIKESYNQLSLSRIEKRKD
jgi:hypothetical protein